MRFQVPQFVDIEDKIVGPLTLKQFLIYLGAVFILIPAYLSFDLSLFVTVTLPILGIAALFAHFKLHGKSLFEVIGHGFYFLTRGQLFLWQRPSHPTFMQLTGLPATETLELSPTELPDTQPSSLSARAQSLETEGNIIHEDAEDPIAAAAQKSQG